jgi:hypothetical protein
MIEDDPDFQKEKEAFKEHFELDKFDEFIMNKK